LFETGDNRTYREDSTGVGLNITKMLVEEQGGKIGVESVLGQGSTFFFQWSK
jgi:signal transduction histidine kinase